jgi:hypothetical protein
MEDGITYVDCVAGTYKQYSPETRECPIGDDSSLIASGPVTSYAHYETCEDSFEYIYSIYPGHTTMRCGGVGFP